MAAAVLPAAASAGGCVPFAFLATGAAPTQPWVAQRMEEKYLHKDDHRTPIMPPIRDGYPAPLCEDPPADREVMRSLPKRPRGVPFVYEEFWDNIVITKSRIVDKIDPPRFFPLVGMAQLHHCHWECAVYYDETIQSSQPFPTYLQKKRVQVVYIDKDHLHLYVGPNPDTQRDTLLELTKY
ncbi:hypothetical protein FRUB_05347 [Fimbriiglobus ruber]|uniref:Uncharacterized protein n=1 Tax=Fimbriiglobus ruber TaxID=1908690 RepID=A0A225DPB1_9BACT|nr:hypothetical protein FRUB_05347 [Fimbriiglobus ruber]